MNDYVLSLDSCASCFTAINSPLHRLPGDEYRVAVGMTGSCHPYRNRISQPTLRR